MRSFIHWLAALSVVAVAMIGCSENSTESESGNYPNPLANTTWFASAAVSGDEDGYLHISASQIVSYDEDFEEGADCWGQHGPAGYEVTGNNSIKTEGVTITYTLSADSSTLNLVVNGNALYPYTRSSVDVSTLNVCNVDPTLF